MGVYYKISELKLACPRKEGKKYAHITIMMNIGGNSSHL